MYFSHLLSNYFFSSRRSTIENNFQPFPPVVDAGAVVDDGAAASFGTCPEPGDAKATPAIKTRMINFIL